MTKIQRTNIQVCNAIIAQLGQDKPFILKLSKKESESFWQIVEATPMYEMRLNVTQNGFCTEIEVDKSSSDQIYHMLSSYIDKHTPSKIDRFITDGGFDKAFQDVFGLPVGVVDSLGEVL